MPTNNSTIDLAALRARHAAATQGELSLSQPYAGFAEVRIGDKLIFCVAAAENQNAEHDVPAVIAKANAFPALADELETLRAESEKLKDDVAEAEERAAEAEERCAEEWEKDCGRALRSIACASGFEWEPDGNPADDVREHVAEAMGELERLREYRKAETNRRGKAEAYESACEYFWIDRDIIGFVSAIRAELERLREETAELKSKWHRESCAHCDERVGGFNGSIYCEECLHWWVNAEMQSEIERAQASYDEVVKAVRALDPAICDYTAEVIGGENWLNDWLASRDARMKREGAAEWLEEAAREGGYYERSSEGMLDEAAKLRGKGEQ